MDKLDLKTRVEAGKIKRKGSDTMHLDKSKMIKGIAPATLAYLELTDRDRLTLQYVRRRACKLRIDIGRCKNKQIIRYTDPNGFDFSTLLSYKAPKGYIGGKGSVIFKALRGFKWYRVDSKTSCIEYRVNRGKSVVNKGFNIYIEAEKSFEELMESIDDKTYEDEVLNELVSNLIYWGVLMYQIDDVRVDD